MTARPSKLGFIAYSTESSWGESSTTMTARIPIIGSEVMLNGLTQTKIPSERITQYLNDGYQDIRGTMSGEFSFDVWLTGYGTTAASTVNSRTLALLLGYALGGSTTHNGTTIDDTSTASSIETTATSGLAAGGLIRVGALGDGRSEGQWAAVSTHSAGTAALLTALPAAPNVADVVYGAAMAYVLEQPSTAYVVQPLRFLLGTGNLRAYAHGCWIKGLSITGGNPGELPRASFTVGVSRWVFEATSTFPNTESITEYYPAPVAAGSYFYNTTGTATRQTQTIRQFEVNVGISTQELKGPGASNSYQDIIGCSRTGVDVGFSYTTDAPAASASPSEATRWDAAESSTTYEHHLFGLNIADGKSVALYFPRAKWVGNRPTQMSLNGLNAVRSEFKALTGPTTTSDLTLSCFRIGLG